MRSDFAVAVGACLLLACAEPLNVYGPPSGKSDAGSEVWTGTSPLFHTCGDDRECENVLGVACLTTYPGGLCTHRCNDDNDCFVAADSFKEGRCVAHVCLPACRVNARTCAEFGAACAPSSMGSSYCMPTCFAADRTPPDRPRCSGGTVCDEHANACFASVRTEGALNGEPCVDDLDCRGEICIRTEFPDGYCSSYGLAPPKSEFIKGQPLPRSTCPPGSVVLPPEAAAWTVGELALCVRGCTSSSECRAGYTCTDLKLLGYTSGFCSPLNCVSEGPCPTGYRCVPTTDDPEVGRCAR